MDLRTEVVALIEDSLNDYFLSKGEKNQLKLKLTELAPDKNVGDFLRSEAFRFAREKMTDNNYLEVNLWLENINKLIVNANKTSEMAESIYFSPGESCLQAIISQIRLAKQEILICLFTISDDRIASEIIARHKNGVKIRLISDNDKAMDEGSDIQKLSQAGIPIRLDVTPNHMHHKFALFDNATVITGSYNWTRSAERYNHENILVTNSAKVMTAFKKEFGSLWEEFPDF